jgi:hypothetical protein
VRIVAERNFGGAMVEATVRRVDHTVSFKTVVASRGKTVREEPVASYYQQQRISHLGSFATLELRLPKVEISRLGHERGRAVFARPPAALVIAIGRHHDDRQIGPLFFDLAQQRKLVHARHVDVGQDDDERWLMPSFSLFSATSVEQAKCSTYWPCRTSRRKCCRNRSATSTSSSTAKMLTLMPPSPPNAGAAAGVP